MEKLTAVLIDTVSIQKYIFASNRLKENLGASFLVENIYVEELKASLQEVCQPPIEINDWRQKPDQIQVVQNPVISIEIGYIGGGNALVFFKSVERAKEFIRHWTLKLLQVAPGIQTAVALEENFNIEKFTQSMTGLFNQLNVNKSWYIPSTSLPKYGITADCSVSGLTMDNFYEQQYMSSVAAAKIAAAVKSQEDMSKKFKKTLAEKFTFTNELDYLGQSKGDSHIAIVHIDGNNMGQRFIDCQTLIERRKLSIEVAEVTRAAFEKLLVYVTSIIDELRSPGSGFNIREEENKVVLPIRPIVLGGDDVTFVTDGRLGVHLAEKFINYLMDIGSHLNISASGGVAITRSKYPFYRGYKLAEELCSSAKTEARTREGSSWLDFYLAYGSLSGDLEEIRKRNYQVQSGLLHFGPYLLSGDSTEERHITHLKTGMLQMGDTAKWPRSKVKDLRSVLSLGVTATEKFVWEMSLRETTLPHYGPREYHRKGWLEGKTPYLDMIELMEYYPRFLLRAGGCNSK